MAHPRLYAGLGVLMIAGFVVSLAWSQVERWQLERHARRSALPACQKQLGELDKCERRIAKHSRGCFFLSYTPGGRGRASRLDEERYAECVMVGPEAYKQVLFERAVVRRKEEAKRRREEAETILGP